MARVLVQNVKVSWTQVEVPDKCPDCGADLLQDRAVSRCDGRGMHAAGSFVPAGTGEDEADDFLPDGDTWWQAGGNLDFGPGQVWCAACRCRLAVGTEQEEPFLQAERAA